MISESKILEGLNPSQLLAVTTLNCPLFVVAGPGSGKTHVLTRRIDFIIEQGARPDSIMALTFTNKAAAEMTERLSEQAKGVVAGTFHSVAARLLRKLGSAINVNPGFTIADMADSRRMMKAVLEADPDQFGKTDLTKLAADYCKSISRYKNQSKTPDHVTDPALAVAWQRYAAMMEKSSVLDFDDLLDRFAQLTQSDAKDYLEQHFQWLLVDEYQDVNGVQAKIVDAFGTWANVCVVGDPDQSIYAFRGARTDLVSGFPNRNPGTQIVPLDVNYRSTDTICRISSAIIKQNPSKFRPDYQTVSGTGNKAKLFMYSDSDSEAESVFEYFSSLGSQYWSECAVLVRTNALTRPLEAAAAAAGVGVKVVGTARFVDRAEIKDVLAWLRFKVNGEDRPAFYRAVVSPRRGVGPAMLAKIGEIEGDLRISASWSKGLAAFFETIDQISLDGGPEDALMQIYKSTGIYKKYSVAADGVDRAGNLDELLVVASTFDTGSGEADVRRFLESVSLSSANDETGGEAVSIMTIHAAKGREFDHVWVVGVEEDILPHISAESTEEERRLLFVATSRARHDLTMSYTKRRMVFGKFKPCKPSRFLGDVPKGLLTFKSKVESVHMDFVGASKKPRFVNTEHFDVGDRVKHKVFGTGVVVSTDGRLMSVEFTEGTKTLLIEVAPVSKI